RRGEARVYSRRNLHPLDVAGPRWGFTRDHRQDELAALDRTSIDGDRDRGRDVIRIGTEGTLLRLEHRLVLTECADEPLEDVVRERLVVRAELADDAPEVMRRGGRLGRDQVEHLAFQGLSFVAGLGRHRSVLDDMEARRREVIGVPAVDAA